MIFITHCCLQVLAPKPSGLYVVFANVELYRKLFLQLQCNLCRSLTSRQPRTSNLSTRALLVLGAGEMQLKQMGLPVLNNSSKDTRPSTEMIAKRNGTGTGTAGTMTAGENTDGAGVGTSAGIGNPGVGGTGAHMPPLKHV